MPRPLIEFTGLLVSHVHLQPKLTDLILGHLTSLKVSVARATLLGFTRGEWSIETSIPRTGLIYGVRLFDESGCEILLPSSNHVLVHVDTKQHLRVYQVRCRATPSLYRVTHHPRPPRHQ